MVPAHHDQFTALVHAKKLSRQRAYQLRQIESGKCRKCNMPRVTKIHCLKHAIYERERQRRKFNAYDEYQSKVRRLEHDFTPPPLEQLAHDP